MCSRVYSSPTKHSNQNGTLLSTKLQLPYFLSPKTAPPPPKREFTSTEAKLEYTSSTLAAFGLSTTQVNQSPPFHIYTDGSCPDQHNISPQNPAGWGVFFESIFVDLYGPVGSLPFPVSGSNNTSELQAPLEAIAFMFLHPPLPPHIIFHIDSQHVIDLLLGLSIPSANIELANLLLDFYHHVTSHTYVELRKVQSHTGISGNDRANLNFTHSYLVDSPPFHRMPSLLCLGLILQLQHWTPSKLCRPLPPPPMNIFLRNLQ